MSSRPYSMHLWTRFILNVDACDRAEGMKMVNKLRRKLLKDHCCTLHGDVATKILT
jgi:hypothetical protein